MRNPAISKKKNDRMRYRQLKIILTNTITDKFHNKKNNDKTMVTK